jgi:hypothetical protein
MNSTISKLQNAFISGSQETNIALATNNFDFTLVKIQAPAEFKQLGHCLSNKRRQLAEDGPQHVTARKLRALFCSRAPSAPNLLAAYGKRVSEIAQMPSINPKGSPADGPFADLVSAVVLMALLSGLRRLLDQKRFQYTC